MSRKKSLNNLKDLLIDKIFDILLKPRTQKFLQPFIDTMYSVYEKYLYKQVIGGSMPRHVAIIPDGNRRWAREHGLDVKEGHRYGYEKMKEVLQMLYDLGIRVVTVYAMSYENCIYRNEEEKNNLFTIIKTGLETLLNEGVLQRYKVNVKVFGKLDLVRKDVLDAVTRIEKESSHYSDRFLNIALCYGGRQEIVDAVKNIAKDVLIGKISVDDISEELIKKYISTSHLNELSEPDLVIRTSGEMRISNFLLWQIAYSELYFCDVYWPDFRKIDLLRAIRSYQRRERRYGR
ncbi:polyprenyl diphosphate synthase [Ignisphaera sp. 4213-co]|uniref:Tritrans,polycis-undecaprenyl-diphosphate synthase (geranylgeranyl-diphosphate specific) n=2 Tax=Ignisphaera cupida TaxID=3050454 RepID=A0ABD4Z4L7_9CREN|nr:polyprenyl diphosphate synthase [Ignisphaera sp. 4213-co]MDK6027855.1 polyprenyl diphosphate synthase [Ignisphaera sp. 4213-co]